MSVFNFMYEQDVMKLHKILREKMMPKMNVRFLLRINYTSKEVYGTFDL